MGGMGMMQGCGMMGEMMIPQGGKGMTPPAQKQEQPVMDISFTDLY